MPGVPTSAGGICRPARSCDPLRRARARARGSSDRPSWDPTLDQRSGYDEATHVLTHAYSLLLGESCIEDIGKMQTDEGIRRIIGADLSVLVEALLVDDPPVDMSVVDVDELAVDVWVVNPVVLLEVEQPSSPHSEHLGATSVMDRRRDVKEKARTRRL